MPNTGNKAKTSTMRQFRQMLEEKSVELRSQMGGPRVNPALQIAADPYDTADFAEKSHEEWIFLQKNSFDTALLREIEEALERLRDGSYGTCLDCGMPVSKKRLEAMPWVRYCVSCQERRQTGNN
ncbi:MAG: TraR/DksA C4-type zinc finger protein [Acidobacteria bacterium]|nr:TraR/DksA C4-type zinc finger protein [Acidobacteriota bacterium]